MPKTYPRSRRNSRIPVSPGNQIRVVDSIIALWCLDGNISLPTRLRKLIFKYRGLGSVVVIDKHGFVTSYDILRLENVSNTECALFGDASSEIATLSDATSDLTVEGSSTSSHHLGISPPNAGGSTRIALLARNVLMVSTVVSNSFPNPRQLLTAREAQSSSRFPKSSPKRNKLRRSWEPTLVMSDDQQFCFRVGGGGGNAHVFQTASGQVELLHMTHNTWLSLPPMKVRRAQCSGVCLPSDIPKPSRLPALPTVAPYKTMASLLKTAPLPSTTSASIPMVLSTAPIPQPPTASSMSCPLPMMRTGSADGLGARSLLYSSPEHAMSTSTLHLINKENTDTALSSLYDETPALLVCGGLDGNTLHRKCEMFYPDEIGWRLVSPLKQARCRHVSLLLRDPGALPSLEANYTPDVRVLVMGGQKESHMRLTACEYFNLRTNKWSITKRSPFSNDGTQSGTCLRQANVVALCGGAMCDNRVALFDPAQEAWREILPCTMQHFVPLVGSINLYEREYLYVLGNDHKLVNFEFFDDRSNEWICIDADQEGQTVMYDVWGTRQFECCIAF